jgi:hypothetical protein
MKMLLHLGISFRLFAHATPCQYLKRAWFNKNATFDGCLSYLIKTFLTSQCRLPHDRVYGLLGLVSQDYRVRLTTQNQPKSVQGSGTQGDGGRGSPRQEYHLEFVASIRNSLGLNDAEIDLGALVTMGLERGRSRSYYQCLILPKFKVAKQVSKAHFSGSKIEN